ncbi:MAG: electron transporter RnfA [Candidatus Methanofastidiosa archaeon]|nr:electron transporter RnfA [Candidatus Methanofastidiosa archaeon]
MRKEQILATNNNETREDKRMKGFIERIKGKLVPGISGAMMCVILMNTICFAASDTSAVTQPLDNLKTLVIAVIGAVGVIILAKNVMEFAQAYQQQDSSTMNSALKGIVAGVMMAGISTVLTFLGF